MIKPLLLHFIDANSCLILRRQR